MEAIYNTIGTGYNFTRQADPYLTNRLLHFLRPGPNKRFLDIGCGTGNYTIALASHGPDFTGVEPSEEMLKQAHEKNQKINWLLGTAEQIPAHECSFDSVIATLTIHHWTNLDKAFNEIYRVTKASASIVLFTATPMQMQGYWLNHYFPAMLRSSISQMPGFDVVKNAMTNAGFKITTTEKYFVQDDLQDHFLYCGKYHPELYFDESVRKGIFSFSALANVEEVKNGLAKLKADLDSGQFVEIKTRYENELGDYLFLVGEKKVV